MTTDTERLTCASDNRERSTGDGNLGHIGQRRTPLTSYKFPKTANLLEKAQAETTERRIRTHPYFTGVIVSNN